MVILVLRFGPGMYFTKDSESMKDFDDEVDSEFGDWDESDSSMDLSQFNDDEDDNNMAWESAKDVTRHTYMDNSGAGEENQQEQSHGTSSGLSRQHASAPCLLTMTYEVPLKDDDKGKGSSPNNRRPSRKEKNNPHILSFHG